MPDNPTSYALSLIERRDFQGVANFCPDAIKLLSDSGKPVDPRLYVCEAIAAAHFGFLDRAKELLKIVWRNKRTILKWGWRGIRFISLIVTLITMPHRIELAIEQLSDLMRDVQS